MPFKSKEQLEKEKQEKNIDSVITVQEEVKVADKIFIRPYFDPTQANMGLEAYEISLFDGIMHEEQLACLEQNGVIRYITGLNEYAPEIKMLEDEDIKRAKIKDIRKVVAQLERELASNIIDIDDDRFWDKVILLKPNNISYWNNVVIRAGNKPVELKPNNNAEDLIKLYAIEAGGFHMIAKSLEHARTSNIQYKFYLDKTLDTISTKTEITKIKNKAIAELQSLYDSNPVKLFYVAKVVDGNSAQYRKSTPNDLIYDNMDKYINGKGVEPTVKHASKNFLETVNMDMEDLKLKAVIKDATTHRILILKSDGMIYHSKTNSVLGRNIADCVQYLKNPLHESINIDVYKEVETKWR